jgi:NADH:ubiquinone oxidoreductase subunit H
VPYVVSQRHRHHRILLWVILSVLAFIWIERAACGLMQNRIGPNRRPSGLLSPIADALSSC